MPVEKAGKNFSEGTLLVSPPEPLAIQVAVKWSQLGGYQRILIPPTIRESMDTATECCSSQERQ